MKTGIYIRVSTEEQALNGFSVRAQQEKLEYYATKIKNWEVCEIYSDEGISGKNIYERPALIELIKDIKKRKIENVLVFKIDRLTRSTKDLIELIEIFNKNNCEFNSLTESIDTSSATGRMFIKIIGIFAEFERENIIERVKLGIERKVKEGYSLCSSTPPYGYDRPIKTNTLIINEIESKIVKKIFKMYLNGKTIHSIAMYLNEKNIKTKKNKKWTYKTIKLILSNSTYIGKVRHKINKNDYYETNGFHIPIINNNIYNNAQKKLIKKAKKIDAYYNHFLKCRCGVDMIPKRTYVNNKVYINYRCKSKKVNCSKCISQKKLDKNMSKLCSKWEQFSNNEKTDYLIQKKITIEINDSLKVIYN